HQQQAVRRQQQTELHADQIKHTEPDQIDLKALNDRHEHRQRDQHHADLIHENSQKNQQQHHPNENGQGGKSLAENRIDDALGGAGKTEDLREGNRSQNDKQNHS